MTGGFSNIKENKKDIQKKLDNKICDEDEKEK